MSWDNSFSVNRRLGVIETGAQRDAQAVVNNYGVHNHGKGFINNLAATAVDATTFMGPIGTAVHGVNGVRQLLKGDFGSALGSFGKGIASLIPGVNLIVGGASMAKNASDTMMHAGGFIEQQVRFGGYENQTRIAQQMFYGNSFGGAALAYGANPYSLPRF